MKADPAAQLACFQQWADSQTPANTPAPSLTTAPANPATGQPATPVLLLPSLNTEAPDGKPIGCKNTKYSELSRFWELQRGTDCDTFSLRGYRPISLAVVHLRQREHAALVAVAGPYRADLAALYAHRKQNPARRCAPRSPRAC